VLAVLGGVTGCFLDTRGSAGNVSDSGVSDDAAISDASWSPDGEVDSGADSAQDPDVNGEADVEAGTDGGGDAEADTDGGDGGCTWSHQLKLEFDNAGQSEDLLYFPILVVLNSSRIDYALTMNAGQDIRFIDADLETELPYQIETWDESGDSHIWVAVPRIDALSTTDHIWLHYGNQSATDHQNASGTWDTSHTGVWHLNADLLDSTTSGHHGTDVGSADAPGLFGKCRQFDGAGAGVNFGTTPGSHPDLTFALWFRTDREDKFQRPIEKRSSAGLNGWSVLMRPFPAADAFPRGLIFRIGSESAYGGWNQEVSASEVYAADEWTFLVGTYDSAKNTGRLYVDGVLVDSRTNADGRGVANVDQSLVIGNTLEAFHGLIDEVRISDVARSKDYVAAQYLSMTDAFITYVDDAGSSCPSE
jgi:hypothetical protein